MTFTITGGTGKHVRSTINTILNTTNISGGFLVLDSEAKLPIDLTLQTGKKFIGDGSELTNLPIPEISTVVPYTGATTDINIGSNKFIGDGSELTNLPPSGDAVTSSNINGHINVNSNDMTVYNDQQLKDLKKFLAQRFDAVWDGGTLVTPAGPSCFAVDTLARKLYVGYGNSVRYTNNEIHRIDLDTQTFDATLSLGLYAYSMAIDSTTRKLYVATGGQGDNIVKVNLDTYSIESTITSVVDPTGLIIDSGRRLLFTSNDVARNSLIKINLDTELTEATLPITFTYYCYAPVNGCIYATNNVGHRVYKVDTSIFDVVSSITLTRANGIATDNAANVYVVRSTAPGSTQYFYKLDLETLAFTGTISSIPGGYLRQLTWMGDSTQYIMLPSDYNGVYIIDVVAMKYKQEIPFSDLPQYPAAPAYDGGAGVLYIGRGVDGNTAIYSYFSFI